MQTPREEQKKGHLGYDVTPADFRVLCEKLDQHIETQNDVLNQEFSAQITFEDSSDFSVGSIQDFAGIDYGSRPQPERFDVSITYLIGFKRDASGAKTYERQVIQIIATNGNPGTFTIRIRSTELTWPPAIMSLLEKEIRALSARTSPDTTYTQKRFFFAASFFRRNRIEIGDKSTIDEMNRLLLRTVFPLLMLVVPSMFLILYLESSTRSDVYIYDPVTLTVSLADFPKLVLDEGWEKAARLAILSKEMIASGYAEYKYGEGLFGRIPVHLGGLLNFTSVLIGLLLGAYFLATVRHGAMLDRAHTGRLFLSSGAINPRAPVSIWTGWLSAIVAAIIANFFTNGLVALF